MRSPIATPPDASKPAKDGFSSGTPSLLIAVRRFSLLRLGSFWISASEMPLTSAPVLLRSDEAMACPSTSATARVMPGMAAIRSCSAL